MPATIEDARQVAAILPHPEQTPVISWPAFLAQFQWFAGEHLTCIGPTGCGKTTTQLRLLEPRRFVTILGTKPQDATLSSWLKEHDYRRLRDFHDPMYGWRRPRVTRDRSTGLDVARYAVWPKFRTMDDRDRMAAIHRDALRAMFTQGGWTICADELFYLSDRLGLGEELVDIWTQGRSLKLSLSGGTQRPRFVPMWAWDQATHLLIWRDTDEENRRRVGGLGGLPSKVIFETVAALPRHWFLYINTRDGRMVVAKAER